MPVYALQCHDCGRRWDERAPVSRRDAIRCACGSTRVPDTDFHRQQPAIQKRWKRGRGGVERRSLALGLEPDQIPQFRRECPSMRFDDDGFAVFDNDSHHRRCMKELNSFRTRCDEIAAPERDRKRKAHEARDRDFRRKVGELHAQIRRATQETAT